MSRRGGRRLGFESGCSALANAFVPYAWSLFPFSPMTKLALRCTRNSLAEDTEIVCPSIFGCCPKCASTREARFSTLHASYAATRKSGPRLCSEGLLLHIRIDFLYAPFFFLFVLDLSLSIPVFRPPFAIERRRTSLTPSSTLRPLSHTKLRFSECFVVSDNDELVTIAAWGSVASRAAFTFPFPSFPTPGLNRCLVEISDSRILYLV